MPLLIGHISTVETKHRSNFPPDLAGLLGIYWIMLPIAAISSLIFRCVIAARNDDSMTVFWVATALGFSGTMLLFLARRPLYRNGRFFQLGPRGLDGNHRRLYRGAWCLIGASIGLFVLLSFVMR